MKPYKHIIFDLDGTLLDTIPDLVFNLNRAFRDLNLPGDFTFEEMATFIGSGKDEQIKRALRARKLNESYFALINERLSRYYRENTDTYTKVFPDVLKTLERLLENGSTLYVGTNKPEHVAQVVVKTFFKDIPFIMVRGDRGDGIVKPNPAFLGTMINSLNVSKDDILFVGDSSVDYLTAKNAGIKCAIVPHGYDKKILELKAPDLIFLKTMQELIG